MSLHTFSVAAVAGLSLVGPAVADPAMSKAIDDHVLARLRVEGVAPAGRADDATLVRRIYFDLVGRPPGVAEAEAFLDDPAPDKAHRLIDRLRLYPESAAHWRRVIADWLQVKGGRFGDDGLLLYLERAVAENRGWDRVVRDLLDPPPTDPGLGGPAQYLARFLSADDPKAGREAATVAVASAFFGAQLQCARCHDHPTVPAWTKAHFDGLRAFFDRTEVEKAGRARRRDSTERLALIEGPAGKDAARPMFLDGKTFDVTDRPRARLAGHALRPEATHFKRAAVNRVWKQLMGRGLVEPVDMIHDGNPASHPRLFHLLADDFADHQFNFDRLVASIMHTDAYLRSARWTGLADRRPAPDLFAVAELRPLSGPQAAWAVAVATDFVREIRVDPRTVPPFVRGPGIPLPVRYKWEQSSEYAKLSDTFREAGPASTAAHAIYLAFDPFLKATLEPKAGGLVRTLADAPDDEAVARRAYLAVLSRRPTPDEVAIVREHLKAAATRADGCRDLAWALVAGAEFRFNH